jgi:hydroxymethylpyrimidine/phosphomethylpyrimidine kinase
MGPEVVVLTGGRRASQLMVDIIASGGKTITLENERCITTNVRGTGDTFSAAIAAGLARGVPATDAVLAAQDFTMQAINRAVNWKLGAGQGPIDHLGHLG